MKAKRPKTVKQFVFPETYKLAADAEWQSPGAYLPQLRSIQKNADINVRQDRQLIICI